MPRFPAPSTVSDAARTLIDSAPPILPLDVSVDALVALRRTLLDTVGPAGREVAKAAGVTVEEARVGGVPVQWVIPRDASSNAVIQYAFGGGYVTGSPEEDLAITARLAAFSGARVCAVRYRLAPEHPYPAQREDALAVYRGLLSSGARKIAVSGESAGGNLSLALIGAAAAEGLPMPVAAALLSPWCDLTHSGDSAATNDGVDPVFSRDLWGVAMARTFAGGQPLDLPGISPIHAPVPKGFPPTLITSGTRDLLLSDCARLSTKLRAAGVAAELRVWEGMWHVFEYYPELPEAEASLNELGAFLKRHLQA
ncbi:MAG: alpha/beta hydrolase [Hyphomicrobiaceae bacterium]